MKGPQRPSPNTTLLDEAPRSIPELSALGSARLHRLADELRVAPKPDGLVKQAEHAKMWRDRAKFLAATDHEKARLVLLKLEEYDVSRWSKSPLFLG